MLRVPDLKKNTKKDKKKEEKINPTNTSQLHFLPRLFAHKQLNQDRDYDKTLEKPLSVPSSELKLHN